MFLFDYLITWKEYKVLLIEQTIKQFDESTQVIEIRSLELEAMFLLNIEELQLVIVEDLLELLSPLGLLDVKFLGSDFIRGVFEVRPEVLQVLLLSLIVLSLELFELPFLFVQGTEGQYREFAMEV
jgi:hypothetical protein